MRRAFLAVAFWLLGAQAHAQQLFTQPGIAITGPGQSTAYYNDLWGKPCANGAKSSGQYPLTNSPPSLGTAAYYTMGDMPDADPKSPIICTSAQWAAVSWDGSGNTWATPTSGNAAANTSLMLAFLEKEKGFSTLAATPAIYYISQSSNAFLPLGNDTTCASSGVAIPNRPDIPCLTTKPVMTALEVATGQTFAGNVTGSGTTITVNSTTQGTLGPGTVITGASYPGSDAVLYQLNATQWEMSKSATVSAESVTGANLKGGAVLVGGGTWANAGNPLYFTAGYSGTPSFLISGSPGYPLYIGVFPGQVVLDETADGSGNAIVRYSAFLFAWFE